MLRAVLEAKIREYQGLIVFHEGIERLRSNPDFIAMMNDVRVRYERLRYSYRKIETAELAMKNIGKAEMFEYILSYDSDQTSDIEKAGKEIERLRSEVEEFVEQTGSQ